jgi:hypothetical protein
VAQESVKCRKAAGLRGHVSKGKNFNSAIKLPVEQMANVMETAQTQPIMAESLKGNSLLCLTETSFSNWGPAIRALLNAGSLTKQVTVA